MRGYGFSPTITAASVVPCFSRSIAALASRLSASTLMLRALNKAAAVAAELLPTGKKLTFLPEGRRRCRYLCAPEHESPAARASPRALGDRRASGRLLRLPIERRSRLRRHRRSGHSAGERYCPHPHRRAWAPRGKPCPSRTGEPYRCLHSLRASGWTGDEAEPSSFCLRPWRSTCAE